MVSITPDTASKGLPTPSPATQDPPSPGSAVAPSAPRNALRSCTLCRQRKVKCDRQQPCSHCVRSKLKCSYPAGRGRAAKRPRQQLDASLVGRLHRMEHLIQQLTSQVNGYTAGGASSTPGQSSASHEPLEEQPSASNSPSAASIDHQLGRLMMDDNKSCYVSNVVWANLFNEEGGLIEELRDMLHDGASEDASNVPTSISEVASPIGTGAAVLGFYALRHSLRPYHPPVHQSVSLLGVFSENVLPLVHIFHMPTTRRMYWDAIASLDSLNRNTEALLFAIYYAAIISIDEDQCLGLLGTTRASCLEKYRFAVEQALARANLLNTHSIILLQAAVVFLTALRNADDSQTTWSLTSLIFHIAQAMGLHRDGSTFGLKPLDTELRRRLWWQICLLDMRSSESHGYEPIVREGTFDTKPPLNINDGDIGAQMSEPPPEHEGYTEMTFTLVRCEAVRAGWRVCYASPFLHDPGTHGAPDERAAVLEDLRTRLEKRYLRHCDNAVPFMHFVSTVARLILARMQLFVHSQYGQRQPMGPSPSLSPATRDKLFATAIEILELSVFVLTSDDVARWAWHSKTHIQWHAVVFVLSEICSRPPSAERDRVWACVSRVHDSWSVGQNDGSSRLWRPVRRLMAKARYVCDMQKIDPTFRPELTTAAAAAAAAAATTTATTVLTTEQARQPHADLAAGVPDLLLDTALPDEYLDFTGLYGGGGSSWGWEENMWE